MKRRSFLVLDLETVVDPDLPPPPKKKDGSDAFPPTPCHQVAVLGAALLDAGYRLRNLWVVGEGKDERAMLAALVGFLNEQFAKGLDVTIVGWNSRGFDLPVIVARCLRYGLAWPWYFQQRDARYRYSPDGHLDLMDFLADFGAGRIYSMDLAAKLVGMPGKLDCKGADVATMVAAGEVEQVRAYCLSDVAQTVAIFLRTQLLRGEVSLAEYRAATQALIAGIEREPRLVALLPRMDRERLLLADAGPELKAAS